MIGAAKKPLGTMALIGLSAIASNCISYSSNLESSGSAQTGKYNVTVFSYNKNPSDPVSRREYIFSAIENSTYPNFMKVTDKFGDGVEYRFGNQGTGKSKTSFTN